jgi:hypothetical protein
LQSPQWLKEIAVAGEAIKRSLSDAALAQTLSQGAMEKSQQYGWENVLTDVEANHTLLSFMDAIKSCVH